MRAHHHRRVVVVVGAQFRSSPRGDRKYNARQISLLVISLQAAFSPLQKEGERAARIMAGDSSNQYSILPFEKRKKRLDGLWLFRYNKLFSPTSSRRKPHEQKGLAGSIECGGENSEGGGKGVDLSYESTAC